MNWIQGSLPIQKVSAYSREDAVKRMKEYQSTHNIGIIEKLFKVLDDCEKLEVSCLNGTDYEKRFQRRLNEEQAFWEECQLAPGSVHWYFSPENSLYLSVKLKLGWYECFLQVAWTETPIFQKSEARVFSPDSNLKIYPDFFIESNNFKDLIKGLPITANISTLDKQHWTNQFRTFTLAPET